MGIPNVKDCTEHQAICCIALVVEGLHVAGTPANSPQVVEMIESFCEKVPSPRWTAISNGVVEKLEYWGIIDTDGEML
jgi:hypothetical protein